MDRRGHFYNIIVARSSWYIFLFLHQMQTSSKVIKENGMLHLEGSWSKEINVKDDEAVLRFRRRVMKDERWAPRMKNLTDVCYFEIYLL